MDSLSALVAMAEVSRGQWGLIRAEQAVAAGVSRSQLSFLKGRGLVTRVRPGTYLMPGVERHRLEGVRAEWLNIGPQACAIASTAILIHGFTPGLDGPIRFASAKRFQGKKQSAFVVKRHMHPDWWEMIDGIPTQKLEHAIVECWNLKNKSLLTSIALAAGIEYWDFVNIPAGAVNGLARQIVLDQTRPFFRSALVSRARRIYPSAFQCDCALTEDLGPAEGMGWEGEEG